MDSEAYWAQRAEEREQYWHKKCQETIERELASYYRASLGRIQTEIAALYGRFAVDNELTMAEARKLLKGNEFRQWRMDIKEYVKKIEATGDKGLERELNVLAMRSRISRLDKLYGETLVELDKLGRKVSKSMKSFLTDAYKDNYYHGLYDIAKAGELQNAVSKVDSKALEDVMRTRWSGKNYSERVWRNQKLLAQTLKDEMMTAVHRGESVEKISKRVAKRMDVGISNARRLVRTELNFVNNQAAFESIEDAGMKYYRFIATLDRRTSDKCRSMDGKVFYLQDREYGVNIPPLHPNCRSTIAGSLYGPGKAKTGTRIAKNAAGQSMWIPADMTYEEWHTVFVDKKITFDAWYAQWKYVNTTKELRIAARKAATAAFTAKAALDAVPNHTYSNIWKDDVTVAEWGAKKDKIPAKKAYFEEQIAVGNDVAKFKLLQQQLEEFDTLGKEYAQKLKAYKAAQESLVQARLELEKHLHGGKTDPYSEERKKRAYRFTSKKDADAVLRSVCGDVWRNATKTQKDAIFEYTCGSGRFNRPLAGFQKPYYESGTGWEPKYYKGPGNVWIDYERAGDEIRAMTAFIERSKYSFDIWLQRGCNSNAMESFLQLKPGTFYSMSQEELQQFVGRRATMDNFISTAASEGAGFSEKEIILNIYVPEGTEMMYAEPFSNFGNGRGVNWDGIQGQKSFSQEFEVILQRGAKYKITHIEKKSGRIYIDMEVHPEFGYNKYQEEDSEWKGSRIDYVGKEH